MKSHQELLNQINIWHCAREHDKIKNAILELPETSRSADLLSLLARAQINADEFTAALEVLEGMAGQSRNDALYCVRRALALWQLNREDEALPWFRKAQELGLGDMDELPGTYFPKSAARWVERAEVWAPRRAEAKAFEAQRRAARNKQPTDAGFTVRDLEGLWDDCEYSLSQYTGGTPAADEFKAVEVELGYRLPAVYKALIQQRNGGMLARNRYPNPLCRDWTTAAFSAESIYGIDRSKPCSLCGSSGTRFWVEEWGYPDIGLVLGDTISAGHQMIFLDYSDCGREGEPCVVYVNQESNYEISYVADNLAEFIRGLEPAGDD
ncbi:MAG: SMI1/KNR4 family protein [Comamonas sp.]|jgi:tetratricopeptide (TPR) repeat protein|nr:SMI1/KNR4 family protein [Comamonas sp.]